MIESDDDASPSAEAAVRADERGRLARELHDGIGQSLVVLSMDAARILRHAERGPETVRPLIDALSSQIDATIALVRTTQTKWKAAAEGNPTPESFARVAARLGEVAARRGGLALRIDVDVDDLRLDPRCAGVATKALASALDNVVRHAGAKRVEVHATLDHAGLVVAVEDDGRGFDPDSAEISTSTGLLSMRERTAAHGGGLRVERRAGGGTRVVLSFPACAPEGSR